MFGYIRPLVSEFDNYLFKSEYCSLCKTLGKNYGQISRLLISYDVTMLSLVLSALQKQPIDYRYENCIVHPIRKRKVKVRTSVEIFSAEVTAVMFRNKFLDQVRDERFLKKRIYRSVYRVTSNWEKKINYKSLLELNGLFDDMYQFETQKISDNVDEISNKFGEILRRVMKIASVKLGVFIPAAAYEFSFLLGKWIYLMDAFEDLKKDLKKWSYNPLLRSNKDLLLEEYENDVLIKEIVLKEKWRLNLLLDHMYDCFMRFEKYLGVYNYEIDGIISRAIPIMTKKILDKTIEEKVTEEDIDGE